MKNFTLLFLFLFSSFHLFAETEEETIAKCLQDMKSTDVNHRRRAALILCKYTYPQVYNQLIPYLEDSDAKVRQTIVVGFIESRMMLANATVPLLKRLTDEDVHTRRMVSSAVLPQLIYYIAYSEEQNEDLKNILIKAVKDEDSIVRKNMLSSFYPLKGVIGQTVFYPLLGDESSEIRLMALNRMSGQLSFDALKPYLKKLCEDKNEKIRELVLKSLSGFGPEINEFLTILAKDEKPTIAARAMAYTRDPQYLAKLQTIILDTNSPSDLVIDLTKTIVTWNTESQNFVRNLLKHNDELRRFAALNSLSRMNLTVEKENLLKLVKDDSSRIRQIVFSHLIRLLLSTEEVSTLSLSEFSDVREFILVYIIRNHDKNKEMLDALYDLMLDEEIKIRTLAISAVWECQAADRYDILSKSLSDNEAEIRNLAARILLKSSDPKAKEILNNFRKKDSGVDFDNLKQLNRIASIQELPHTKPQNWRQLVKDALNDENMEIKKAAIDVIVTTRDPELFNSLRIFLEVPKNRHLVEYVLEKISESEKLIQEGSE